jgi:hypothetical protein
LIGAIRLAFALVWGMIFELLAVFCCLTIILTPVGIILAFIGAYPFMCWLRRKSNEALGNQKQAKGVTGMLKINDTTDVWDYPFGKATKD